MSVAVSAALAAVLSVGAAASDGAAGSDAIDVAHLERALEASAAALARAHVEVTRSRAPTIDAESLRERWDVGPDFLAESRQVLAVDGARWYVRTQRFREATDAEFDGDAAEAGLVEGGADTAGASGGAADVEPFRDDEAFHDGAVLALGAGQPRLTTIYDRVAIEDVFDAGARLYEDLYFDAIGFDVADRVGELGAPTRSRLLAEMRAADAVACAREGDLVRVDLDLGEDRSSVWLDAARGHVLVRSERRRAGRLLEAVATHEHVDVGGVWLPRRVERAVYARGDGDAEASDAPLLHETIVAAVVDLDPGGAPLSAESIAPPGTFIADTRHSDELTAYDGFLSYVAPHDPERLWDEYVEATAQEPARPERVVPWVSAHVVVLLIVGGWVLRGPRPPERPQPW